MSDAVPLIAAVAAAVLAGFFSLRAAQSNARAERASALLERQRQLTETFFSFYNGVLDSEKSGKKTDPESARVTATDFMVKVQMYGSDNAVRATHRWIQSTYNDAPVEIQFRLITELLLALRADILGVTELSAPVFAGLRLNDLYDGDLVMQMQKPLREHCEGLGWKPPWPKAIDEKPGHRKWSWRRLVG